MATSKAPVEGVGEGAADQGHDEQRPEVDGHDAEQAPDARAHRRRRPQPAGFVALLVGRRHAVLIGAHAPTLPPRSPVAASAQRGASRGKRLCTAATSRMASCRVALVSGRSVVYVDDVVELAAVAHGDWRGGGAAGAAMLR